MNRLGRIRWGLVFCLGLSLLAGPGCRKADTDETAEAIDPASLPESQRPIGFEIPVINPKRPPKEPDWDVRYAEIRNEMATVAQETFALPPVGSQLTVALRDGTQVTGEFGGQMEGGAIRIRANEYGFLGYTRDKVADNYRPLFWQRDFYWSLVRQKLQREMDPYGKNALTFMREKAAAERAARLADSTESDTAAVADSVAEDAPVEAEETLEARIERLGADPNPAKQLERSTFIETLRGNGFLTSVGMVSDEDVRAVAGSRWFTATVYQQQEIMRTLYDFYSTEQDHPVLVRLIHPMTDHEIIRRDKIHGLHRIQDLNQDAGLDPDAAMPATDEAPTD